MDQSWTKDLLDEHVLSICAAWGIDTQPLPEKFREGESFIYRGTRKGQTVAIRITHPKHRSLAEIEAELLWMERMDASGVLVPIAIRTLDEKRVIAVRVEEFVWHACVWPWIEGDTIDPKHKLWQASTHERLGTHLGRMQRSAKECSERGQTIARHTWDDPKHCYLGHRYESRFPENAQAARELLQAIQAIPKTGKNFGLVHTDLHHGNLICTDHETHVIDFDDMCYHYFLQDLMMPVYYAVLWAGEDWKEAARSFASPLFRGYKKEGPMPSSELSLSSLFLRLRDFELMYVTDLWGLAPDSPWYVRPASNVTNGNRLCTLPWREWFEEA